MIVYCFFFFNDTATTEIYTLSLHDALPISRWWTSARPMRLVRGSRASAPSPGERQERKAARRHRRRSEEHTSELQSRQYLVCRLLLEKKKQPDRCSKPYRIYRQTHDISTII